jgi:hypothetical protein
VLLVKIEFSQRYELKYQFAVFVPYRGHQL